MQRHSCLYFLFSLSKIFCFLLFGCVILSLSQVMTLILHNVGTISLWGLTALEISSGVIQNILLAPGPGPNKTFATYRRQEGFKTRDCPNSFKPVASNVRQCPKLVVKENMLLVTLTFHFPKLFSLQ